MADLEGRILDRYELQELTGRGGMADVYLAYDPHFEREVAVKVFKREDEDLLRRFVREAQLMASLHNAHLMPVYDTGSCRIDGVNVYYIVMPYMDGGTLRARVRRSPVPLKEACSYLRDISEALDYMHQQGIIHRDIKSSNVMLDADGRCYLADFGIARSESDATQLTTTGNVLGTVDYIAPELFESDYRADPRSDYYSLGVLLYEMVTGHLPFVAENQIAVVAMHVNKLPPSPRTYVASLSPAVEQVLMKALEKRPELRYPSATALADAFCRATTAKSGEFSPIVNPQRQQNNGALINTGRQSVPLIAYQPAPQLMPASMASSTGHYNAPSGVYPVQGFTNPQQFVRKDNASRTQTWLLTILVIVVLVVVAVPMTYIVMNMVNHPAASGSTPTPGAIATPNLQGTAQAIAQAASATAVQQGNVTATAAAQATGTAHTQATGTATAKTHATATAQAQATATANANATATPGVLQTATATTPVYTDPLTNPDSTTTQAAQWDQSVTCTFTAAGYQVAASSLHDFSTCHEAATAYANFTAQVDISIQSGHSGGLFFRMTGTPLQGYLFEIDSQGHYKISVANSASLSSLTPLRDWTASSALKTGLAKNQLQVIAKGSTLLFYINGVYQPDSIQDTTLSSGNVGFLATSENGDDTKVVYSNLSIYPVS
jgi:eukaryotic-like serine/threonine-protein kinase